MRLLKFNYAINAINNVCRRLEFISSAWDTRRLKDMPQGTCLYKEKKRYIFTFYILVFSIFVVQISAAQVSGDKIGKIDWSVFAFGVTAVALIIGFITLLVSLRQNSKIVARLENLENHDEEITANLQVLFQIVQKDIPARFEQLDANLQATSRRINAEIEKIRERTETTSWVNYLRGEGWNLHLERVKDELIDRKPRYIEPREGKKMLTEEGRQLLDSETINRLKQIMESSPDLSTNDIILHLDVSTLYPKAMERDISLDTMVAVVAAYIDEVKPSERT